MMTDDDDDDDDDDGDERLLSRLKALAELDAPAAKAALAAPKSGKQSSRSTRQSGGMMMSVALTAAERIVPEVVLDAVKQSIEIHIIISAAVKLYTDVMSGANQLLRESPERQIHRLVDGFPDLSPAGKMIGKRVLTGKLPGLAAVIKKKSKQM